MKIKLSQTGGLLQYAPMTHPMPAFQDVTYATKAAAIAASKGSTSSSSLSSTSGGSGFLADKELMKSILEHSLPSDAHQLMSMIQSFESSISQGFGSGSEYNVILTKLNEARSNKKYYDDILTSARSNNTLNEVAITPAGYVFYKNKDGQVSTKPVSKVTPKDWLLTNGQIAQLRAYDTNFAFDKGQMTDIIANGVSSNDVIDYFNKYFTGIGKMVENEEYFIAKGTAEEKQLIKGYKAITNPDAVYKYEKKASDNSAAVDALLRNAQRNMPQNMKAWLIVQAKQNGTTVEKIISDFAVGKRILSIETDQSLEGGKSGSSSSSSSGKGSNKDIKSNVATRFFSGYGEKEYYMFRQAEGLGAYYAYGNTSQVMKDNKPMDDKLTLSDLQNSDFVGGLKLEDASFGGVPVSLFDGNKILVDGRKIIKVELPYREINGRIVPEIEKMNVISKILKTYAKEIADKKYDNANAAFKANQLPAFFDRNGNTTHNYKPFAVLQAFTDEDVIHRGEGEYKITGEYVSANDYETGQVVEFLKTRNKKDKYKYNPPRPTIPLIDVAIPYSKEKIVKSMVFIPILQDTVNWQTDEYDQSLALQQETLVQENNVLKSAPYRYTSTKNPY